MNDDLPEKIPRRNKAGRPREHALYSNRKPISELDGRTRQAKAFKVFREGIQEDLGQDLSFAQMALAETAFQKFYLLSECVRLLSQKKDGFLRLFFSKNLNVSLNATSNSFRCDLREIYGEKGLKKVERKFTPMAERLAALAARSAKKEGDGNNGKG